jgi:glyoxylase-like metal-dependent hydrolase (beta-lactamase superfamily II)
MKKLYLLIFFVLIALSAGFAVAQQDFSKVEIKSTQVAGNVYMLEGSGGNIGVSVGEDGILIVDDQFAPLADKIRAALKGLSSGKLQFILNTHWHGDHTGGNEAFGPEATVIAHTNVRKRLMTEQNMSFFNRVVPPKAKEAWPVITFDTSLSVHFNGEEIKAVHYPNGHTDGDGVIFFTKSNVVHMGDQFFSGMFPFVDLDSGGDVEGYIKNVEKVISELPSDVKIIPGHGPLSNLDDLKSFHQMLVETTEIVRKRLDSGKSLDEIKSEGLPEKWQSWSWQFITTDKWLEIVFNSLSKKGLRK